MSASCTQLSRNIPPTNTHTRVYIKYTAVQEYPSYKHTYTCLYHVHNCPGISLLQTHIHMSASCIQLSRNIPPTNTHTHVCIMCTAVQEYPSCKHTYTCLYHVHSCPGISLLQTHIHMSASCAQLSRNIPPANTHTHVCIMYTAVQEYPSYKHTYTCLHHVYSCPGISLLQTHIHVSASCTQLCRNIPPTNTHTRVCIMYTAVQEYPSYKHTYTCLHHVYSCPGISLLQTHIHMSASCIQLSRNIPPTNTHTHVCIMYTAVQEYPSYKHTYTCLHHVYSCPGISLLQTHIHMSASCIQLSRNIPPTNTHTHVCIMYTAVQEYPSYKHTYTCLHHVYSCPGISLLQTHIHMSASCIQLSRNIPPTNTHTHVCIMYTAVQEYPSYKHTYTCLYHVYSCPGISLLQRHIHMSVSCIQLSRNIPPTNTHTHVCIMYTAVQEYPSYKHTYTCLYHVYSCPGISLLQTHIHMSASCIQLYLHSAGISLLQTHIHMSASCIQLSRNIPPTNTHTHVCIMYTAVQEYPSYKHTYTCLYHVYSCPGISLLQTHIHMSVSCIQLTRNIPPTNTHIHMSVSCTQLSRNIPPTNTHTRVCIMYTAVQEYPSYKHTYTCLYHVHSCPGISLLQTHIHMSASCTQLSRNIPPTNTHTHVCIMYTAVQEYPSYKHTHTHVCIMYTAVQEYPSYKHTHTHVCIMCTAVQEYPSYKHTYTCLHHVYSCPGTSLLQTHIHMSASCAQLSRNIPPTNTHTHVCIMCTAVQEYPSYKHTYTCLHHVHSCPGISLLQTHIHMSASCIQLSRNIPPTNTHTHVYIMYTAVQEYPSYKHTQHVIDDLEKNIRY